MIAFILEICVYLSILWFALTGVTDLLSALVPFSSILLPVVFCILLLALLIYSAFSGRSPTNRRSMAWLGLMGTIFGFAASESTIQSMANPSLSPLALLFYGYVIAFSATGRPDLCIGSILYSVLASLLGILGRYYFGDGPTTELPAFFSERIFALLPFISSVVGAGILAFVAGLKNTAKPAVQAGSVTKHPPCTSSCITKKDEGPQEEQEEDNRTGSSHTRSISVKHIGDLREAESVTTRDLLASVVYFMSRNFRGYSSLGFIYDQKKSVFTLNSFCSKSTAIIKDVQIPTNQGIVGRMAVEMRSFLSGDLTYYNHELQYYSHSEMINSILATPIISHTKELLGALVIDSRDKSAFREQHKETMNRFSSLAAALITNLRMRVYQERAAKQFQIFYQASEKFTTTLNTIQVIDVAIQMISQLIRFVRVMAVTFDVKTMRGTVVRVAGTAQEIPQGSFFTIGDGLFSYVFRNRRAVNIPDIAQYEHQIYRLAPGEPANSTIRSILVLPILDDELGCRGILSMESDVPGYFQGEAEQVLSTLAGNVSVAYVRALLYQRMEMLATTDGLTMLSNHRFFQEHLTREMERASRYKRTVALILMDIDHFKNFNDTYGHPIGDLVLREIAGCIKSSIRTNDLPARYGGEEFAVIIPETNDRDVITIAERIRRTIETNVITVKRQQLNVTVSIGCAMFPHDGKDQASLIECADKAMYYSKDHGRNQITRYRKGMQVS